MTETRTGGCLCGAVTYRVAGPISDAHACHCGQCRRQSGHYVVGAQAKKADIEIEGEAAVTWYRSSEQARRGFCSVCGSVLFWDEGGAELSICAGGFDRPSGLTLKSHIFVDDKGDYYDLDDELPKFAGYDRPL